ncbi:hypothetical protein [Staphylococcus equorum]|uniref:hypothetical protein n=1 Tax=Staphylococcus equorum TaxID=246432 RepID=UPI000852A3E4|nr:hypothetical protein [Staphylococcus equorum]OEK70610.1 hypothetical protein AST02_03925 [Staphylococcus equorum]
MKLYRISDSFNETLFATTDIKEFNKKLYNLIKEVVEIEIEDLNNLTYKGLLQTATDMGYQFNISKI